MANGGGTSVLSKGTLVPLGAVVATMAIIGSGTLALNNRLMSIDVRLDQIETGLRMGAKDQWTGSDMKHWATLLEAKNATTIVVPKPESSSR